MVENYQVLKSKHDRKGFFSFKNLGGSWVWIKYRHKQTAKLNPR